MILIYTVFLVYPTMQSMRSMLSRQSPIDVYLKAYSVVVTMVSTTVKIEPPPTGADAYKTLAGMIAYNMIPKY